MSENTVAKRIIVAMAALRVGGHEPVRIYLSHEALDQLTQETTANMMPDPTSRHCKKFYGLPITESTLGPYDRVVDTRGNSHPI